VEEEAARVAKAKALEELEAKSGQQGIQEKALEKRRRRKLKERDDI